MFALFARVPNTNAAVKVWEGADTSVAFSGPGGVSRDYDAAIGWAVRNATDCVLRDSTDTDPRTRIRVIAMRHGVGNWGDGS